MSGGTTFYARSDFFGRILPISAPQDSYIPLVPAIIWIVFNCFADGEMLQVALERANPEHHHEIMLQLTAAARQVTGRASARYFHMRGRYVAAGEIASPIQSDGQIPADALHEFELVDLGIGALRRGEGLAWTHAHHEVFQEQDEPAEEAFYQVRVDTVGFMETFGIDGQAKRRGRPKGSGSYATADKLLFKSIDQLIEEGRAYAAYGAAILLKDEIAGDGSELSKIERLAKRYLRSKMVTPKRP